MTDSIPALMFQKITFLWQVSLEIIIIVPNIITDKCFHHLKIKNAGFLQGQWTSLCHIFRVSIDLKSAITLNHRIWKWSAAGA